MRYAILVVFVAGMALGAASLTSVADQQKGVGARDHTQDQSQVRQQDKDRLHDKERIQEQERIELRTEEIYGYKLMSPEELNQYRERLRSTRTEEERTRLEAQHREEMQKRAQALNVKIEDAE